ncbi:hypothetical protein [Streptomyces sp. NPDC002690]
MRASLVRRSALAASVASLVLLATACGGSSDDSDSKGKESASGESKTSNVKALTAAELEKVALADGDVAGHKIEKAGAADILKAADVTSDKAECLPFAHALFAVPQGKPVASTARTATTEPKASDAAADAADAAGDMTDEDIDAAMNESLDVSSTMIDLASYEGGDAADVVAAVRKAAAACASGFTATVQGDAQKLSGITEAKVSGGEEAVAWDMVAEQEGTKIPFGLVVMRQGSTVSTFTTINMAAAMGQDVKLEQPTAVVDAQVKKVS